VSDFGLAGTVKNTSQMVSKSGVGTINWSAPEVFKEHCEW
jgi:serine/threonine protein kinase